MDVLQYDLPESASGSRFQYLVLGGIYLVFAIASIFVGVRYDMDFVGSVFLSIFLSLGAAYFYRAWATRPSLQSVVAGPEGLVFVFPDHEAVRPWTDFVHTLVSTSAMTSEPVLLLYDTSGRLTVRVPGGFDQFEALCEVVQEQIHTVRHNAEQRVRLQRHWLLAAMFLLFGFPLTIGFGILVWWTLLELWETWGSGEPHVEIPQLIIGLLFWLFGLCMGGAFVAAGSLHLFRLEVARNSSGVGFEIRREPEY